MKSFKKFLKEDWWSDLSPEGQEQYIADHPNSEKAQTSKNKEQEEPTSHEEKVKKEEDKTLKAYNKRQEIKDIKTVQIPKFTKEEIDKSKRNPYIFTPEGQYLMDKYAKARNADDEVLIQYYMDLIDTNNKKYNAESVAHLKGALSPDKYYVMKHDFNNKDIRTFDIWTVGSLNSDGTYDFMPMGGKPSDKENSKWWGSSELIELNKDQAKQLFATMDREGAFGGLTHGEEKLIQTYTYATPENSALRKGEKSERAKKMNQIINKCYNQKANVYRGITGEYAKKLLDLKPGDTITEPGFSSTSSAKDVAETFAKDGVLLDIEVPEGWGNMVSASEYTMHPEESEYIINSGAKFEVVSKEGNTLKVKLLPFENKDE